MVSMLVLVSFVQLGMKIFLLPSLSTVHGIFHISYLLAFISSLLDVLSDQCLLVIFNPLSCMIRKESLLGFDVQALGFQLTSMV